VKSIPLKKDQAVINFYQVLSITTNVLDRLTSLNAWSNARTAEADYDSPCTSGPAPDEITE
jgi:hypothetical protein